MTTLIFNYKLLFHNISASGDYSAISEEVTFSRTSLEQTVVVNIADDDLLEIDEVFTAMLGLVNGDRVILRPMEASVTILDNDGECIMEARELIYYTHTRVALSLTAEGE